MFFKDPLIHFTRTIMCQGGSAYAAVWQLTLNKRQGLCPHEIQILEKQPSRCCWGVKSISGRGKQNGTCPDPGEHEYIQGTYGRQGPEDQGVCEPC